MSDTDDRAQLQALGALRAELARATRDRDALRAALDSMTAERDAVGEAMLAVVDALPRCTEPGCNAPATWRDEYDQTLTYCDLHNVEHDEELPWAAALRTLDRVSREQGEVMEARTGGVR